MKRAIMLAASVNAALAALMAATTFWMTEWGFAAIAAAGAVAELPAIVILLTRKEN